MNRIIRWEVACLSAEIATVGLGLWLMNGLDQEIAGSIVLLTLCAVSFAVRAINYSGLKRAAG